MGQHCLLEHCVSMFTCLFKLCLLQQSEESLPRSQPCRLQQQQQQRLQLCLRSPHCLSSSALLLFHPHPRRPLQWESYQTCTGLACWTCRETGIKTTWRGSHHGEHLYVWELYRAQKPPVLGQSLWNTSNIAWAEDTVPETANQRTWKVEESEFFHGLRTSRCESKQAFWGEKGKDPLHIWRESSCPVPLEPSLNTHRSCSRVGFGPLGWEN